MNLDVGWIRSASNNKAFDLALPEWNDNPASRCHCFIGLVNKRARQRQTHRNIDVHAGLRTQAEEFCANLLHVFPDVAFFLGGTQEIGRMESRDDAHAVDIEELSAQLRDR